MLFRLEVIRIMSRLGADVMRDKQLTHGTLLCVSDMKRPICLLFQSAAK